MISAEHLTQLFIHLIPLMGHAGFKVDEAREGWVRTSMPLEANRNHLGSFYAGSLLSMAEISGGALLATVMDFSEYRMMVKSINIEYHRLALSDVHCELTIPDDFVASVRTQCEQDGKAFYTLPVVVFDADNTPVATAQLNYRLKPTT